MISARFSFAILVLALLPLALMAQNSAIQGVIVDSSGAVVPNAAVRVTNLDTGVVQSRVTNDVGFYTVPALNAGRYSVDATASGFAPQQRPEMRLEVGQTARVDFELKVGNVAETVEVSAAAQLLNTETTEVGQVIDNKRIVEMPLNGRNYLQLAQFSAGVAPGRQMGRGARSGEDGNFIAMGLAAAQNTVLLDGNDNSSRTSGGPLGWEAQAVKPAVDAVAEFKVVTNNTSAEYGYRSGAKVLVNTKSGTNAFHGSLFEFLRNDKLDGTNFFANRAGSSKPTYRQNQFGGTLGGPVLRNRTFFFGSYQGTRIRLGKSYVSTVPSQEVRSGDFSNQPPQIRNIFDPEHSPEPERPHDGSRSPTTAFRPTVSTLSRSESWTFIRYRTSPAASTCPTTSSLRHRKPMTRVNTTCVLTIISPTRSGSSSATRYATSSRMSRALCLILRREVRAKLFSSMATT
jgi:hypothetical protein